MVQKVIWTVSAYRDLQNIVEYISQDSMYYAISFYDNVMDKAQTLNEFPHRGRVVPEMGDPDMRELFIHRYRLIYKLTAENVIITTIIHGARDYKNV
jgi:toxin ParE1/3/4